MRSRTFLTALAAVVAGALAGGIGSLVVLSLDDDGAAPAATPTPTVEGAPTVHDARSLFDSAAPSIVTVVATLPATTLDDGRELERRSVGSGIVFDTSGVVITNYHVIEGADTIEVVLATGEPRPAALVADDWPFQDLAILVIPGGGLRSITVGSSQALVPGDAVAALSAGLFEFDIQIKTGVVSALDVDFERPGFVYEGMVQTDAAVNVGDSGGALVDAEGRLVGLLTIVVRTTPTGDVVSGVALARAIDDLLPAIEAVLATGVNPRPRYGIERVNEQHIPVTDEVAQERGLPVGGALVLEVAPGSPADLAGVRPGDVVVAADGLPIERDHRLVTALAGGAPVTLDLARNGEPFTVTLCPTIETREGSATRGP